MGIFPQKFTVPMDFLEVVGYNIPRSIPDSWKHDSTEDRKGEPEVLDLISRTEANGNSVEPQQTFQTLKKTIYSFFKTGNVILGIGIITIPTYGIRGIKPPHERVLLPLRYPYRLLHKNPQE